MKFLRTVNLLLSRSAVHFNPLIQFVERMKDMRKATLKVSLLASALMMSMASSAASEKIVVSEDVQVKDVAPAGFSLDISAPPAEQKTKPKGPRLPPASKK